MSFKRLLGVAVLATLLCAPAASGQSVEPARDLDLPLEKPDPKKPQPPKPPEPDPPIEQGDEKPPTIYGQEIKSENDTVFYVIDISGSMMWDLATYTTPEGGTATGVRMDRAKAALVTSVMGLPENFKFNLLAYDCSVRQWSSEMVIADLPNKQSARAWIMALRPLGGTSTGPAVSSALQLRENKCVVLLTDGEPNCGAGPVNADGSVDGKNIPLVIDAHRSMIRTNNVQNAIISVFGIGAMGEFKKFCMNVASDNGGTYTDVR